MVYARVDVSCGDISRHGPAMIKPYLLTTASHDFDFGDYDFASELPMLPGPA